MKGKAVDHFFHSAVQYCSVIENFDSNQDENKFKTLLLSLLDLYSKALHLPDIDPGKSLKVNVPLPQINFDKYEYYWEVFNPYKIDEPVCGSLSDDTLDIYKDVKEGIISYQKNHHNEAIWGWKFSFESHWGNHAVDAMRALHSVNFDEIDDLY
ncbi:DUF5063 domain-containing protein [Bacillus sp. ISL-18]|uniref:DUF5063 domain-containing protein n=1 Tax=Bacillus sp. ISL-18 TaxID=2819118 RepID=UPI001BEC510B|nr:DUF5063 domain-containing protein [Bacillus sp. ISL-18]MBT2657968.1 DUF5063 domain-containing protein [Bacillus sp. ISL-18]